MNLKNLDKFIEKAEKTLPDLVSDKDLVGLGLFSLPWLCNARRRGESAPFLKIRGKYLYLKPDALDWIRGLYVNSLKKVKKDDNDFRK